MTITNLKTLLRTLAGPMMGGPLPIESLDTEKIVLSYPKAFLARMGYFAVLGKGLNVTLTRTQLTVYIYGIVNAPNGYLCRSTEGAVLKVGDRVFSYLDADTALEEAERAGDEIIDALSGEVFVNSVEAGGKIEPGAPDELARAYLEALNRSSGLEASAKQRKPSGGFQVEFDREVGYGRTLAEALREAMDEWVKGEQEVAERIRREREDV